jgi:methionyl-tRNA synthetase
VAKFYLTTAIVYVNDAPGLHFLYEQIGADALARFHRQRGDDVFFLTGTDENAGKNERAAGQSGEDTKAFVDRLAGVYREAARVYGISHDRFIRTTDPDHVRGVQALVKRWIENGDVYEGTYEGLYCESCEAFYEESDLVAGACPFHPGRPLRQLSERNYFFRLSRYEAALKDLYARHPEFTVPEVRRNEVLAWFDRGLKDVSISRRGQSWGVPFPGDPDHVVYVWFDALINYLTGAGFGTDETRFRRFWPADLHIIGKDITRFHCIYWPAMLIAAGIALPRQVFAHGFLNYQGQRLSKTSGNMIDPFAAAEEWGADAVRYLLLRQAGFYSDADVSPAIFTARYNADLANNLGNLVQRTVAMIARYRDGTVPRGRDDSGLRETVATAVAAHDAAAKNLAFDQALAAVFDLVDATNKHYDETRPWTLARDPSQAAALDSALYAAAEAVRIISQLLWPYVPGAAEAIAASIGAERPAASTAERWREGISWGRLRPGTTVRAGPPLFPRIEAKEEVAT